MINRLLHHAPTRQNELICQSTDDSAQITKTGNWNLYHWTKIWRSTPSWMLIVVGYDLNMELFIRKWWFGFFFNLTGQLMDRLFGRKCKWMRLNKFIFYTNVFWRTNWRENLVSYWFTFENQMPPGKAFYMFTKWLSLTNL